MSGPFQFVLASASPRRRELLQQIGARFHVIAVDVDETPAVDEPPETYVRRLALLKARLGYRQALNEGLALPALGADTAVIAPAVPGRAAEIFGKPRDRAHGIAMLRRLSGGTHTVMTAVALAGSGQPAPPMSESATAGALREACCVSVSTVTFRVLPEPEIASYWDDGEPRDKAGAYAIQGRGAVFVQRIAGSYSGIVGLPLFETAQLLAEFGVVLD